MAAVTRIMGLGSSAGWAGKGGRAAHTLWPPAITLRLIESWVLNLKLGQKPMIAALESLCTCRTILS